MEIADDVPTVWSTLHYGGQPTAAWLSCAGDGSTAAITDDWHEFAVVWSARNLTFMLDGVPYYTSVAEGWDQTLVRNPLSASAPFDVNYFIMLNLAVGNPSYEYGFTKMAPDWTETSMLVDWVRVYGMPAAWA